MITIHDTSFTSNIDLAKLLAIMSKEKLAKISDKLDFYVSKNIKKEEMARRLAYAMLDAPDNILLQLSKTELEIIDEFVKAGANHYAVRKMRKTYYKLQNWGLVLTYEDEEAGKWHLLMPDCVCEVFAQHYQIFYDMAMKGIKRPSLREYRFMSLMYDLHQGVNGEDENENNK